MTTLDYSDTVWLLIWMAGVHRIARLVTVDKITKPWRDVVKGDWQPGTDMPMRVYFAYCLACWSIWIALLTAWAPILLLHLDWWSYPFLLFAASMWTILWASKDQLPEPDET